VKFTPNGGIIGVTLKADETNVTVSVRDTGCGIRPEVGKHIFEKFYQGDTSHAMQGNGLGLALVKRVVDILSSEISVQSTPGQGSTFTVRIRRNCA
jgi:signal transduction histidine kinase